MGKSKHLHSAVSGSFASEIAKYYGILFTDNAATRVAATILAATGGNRNNTHIWLILIIVC